MRRSGRTPSIVPRSDDHNVYLVVDDLGRLGRVWREADYETWPMPLLLPVTSARRPLSLRSIVFPTF